METYFPISITTVPEWALFKASDASKEGVFLPKRIQFKGPPEGERTAGGWYNDDEQVTVGGEVCPLYIAYPNRTLLHIMC